MLTAPYGSWDSPVSVELMTSASVGLGAPTLDGSDLYWLESRADQGGRASLMRWSGDGAPVELTPAPWYVRTRVNEYGGGEYAVRDGVVVFSHFADGRLYLLRDSAEPTPLTPPAGHRFADLRVHPDLDLVLAVREDHTGEGEPVTTLVALTLSGGEGANPDGGTVLCSGADFYASPELSRDGRLAWVEWDHPQMPWDATRLLVGRLDGHRVSDSGQVAGGERESAVHPRWTPDGTLVFLSDRSDWWNPYAWCGSDADAAGEVRCLHQAAAEFTGPMWRLGQHPYAVVGNDELLVSWGEDAGPVVGLLRLSDGERTALGPVGTGTGSLTVSGGRGAAVLSSPDRAPRLAVLDLSSRSWTEVRAASEVSLPLELVSVARPVTWPSEPGPVYGWFYPPTNPGFRAPEDTAPPLLTLSHGGPTANSPASFSLAVQYWTSRGVAVLDVNYGGSTGYGRAYRERLQGRWGLVDVADCAAGAVAMGAAGLVDGQRLAIAGGSAGGYTTLRGLTATTVFAAGISRYGVGDLESLARDTHKFESRYLDGLVGPYPAAAATYRERSPINHVDSLSAPILLLQGTDDRVVPPNQAEAMAAAARAKGLPVALIMFEGEGHGFRRADNIRAATEAELYFLGRIFGFAPADELPEIEIEQLG